MPPDRPARQPFGDASPYSKLTTKQVLEIRNATWISQRRLADKYGVNQSTICRIRIYRKRKHDGDGESVQHTKARIIALADKGPFSDRSLETLFKGLVYECGYALDQLIKEGLIEVYKRPAMGRPHFFVYRKTKAKNLS